MELQEKCPSFMTISVFEKLIPFPSENFERRWEKLNKRETFCAGQVFPYQVDFESGHTTGDFYEGEKNIHHGPLLSVHGEIGKITPEYRDLKYYYGSYVLSFRFIRPQRLEFFREEGGIRVRMTCYVRPWIKGLWEKLNDYFWALFPRTLK